MRLILTLLIFSFSFQSGALSSDRSEVLYGILTLNKVGADKVLVTCYQLPEIECKLQTVKTLIKNLPIKDSRELIRSLNDFQIQSLGPRLKLRAQVQCQSHPKDLPVCRVLASKRY